MDGRRGQCNLEAILLGWHPVNKINTENCFSMAMFLTNAFETVVRLVVSNKMVFCVTAFIRMVCHHAFAEISLEPVILITKRIRIQVT